MNRIGKNEACSVLARLSNLAIKQGKQAPVVEFKSGLTPCFRVEKSDCCVLIPESSEQEMAGHLGVEPAKGKPFMTDPVWCEPFGVVSACSFLAHAFDVQLVELQWAHTGKDRAASTQGFYVRASIHIGRSSLTLKPGTTNARKAINDVVEYLYQNRLYDDGRVSFSRQSWRDFYLEKANAAWYAQLKAKEAKRAKEAKKAMASVVPDPEDEGEWVRRALGLGKVVIP